MGIVLFVFGVFGVLNSVLKFCAHPVKRSSIKVTAPSFIFVFIFKKFTLLFYEASATFSASASFAASSSASAISNTFPTIPWYLPANLICLVA